MSGCKRWVLLGCLVSAGCKEVPEDFSSATSGAVVDAGTTQAPSADSGSTSSSDAAAGDAAADASADATSSDTADASASAADAQVLMGDAAVAADSGFDASADASADGGANPADGATADAAASGWPSGCTVYRLSAAEAIDVPAEAMPARDIVLPAPWGTAQAQALAFRSLPDSPALREMSLQTASGAPLMLSGPLPVVSPALPADVGMYVPSGASSLRLRLQFDSRGRAASQDRSGFEVCVVTGTGRRAKTAAVAAVSPAARDVPAMVENYELSSRCRLHLSQPVQILAVQPFARKRAVSTRLAHVTGDASPITSVIQQGAYSSADPKLLPLATPITVVDGGELISGCSYSNASDQSYSFGVGLEDEACANFLLHVPRGAFNCALED